MKFDELKVELNRELSKLGLPRAGNKAELQKRLIDKFKRRDIDIGTYEFEYKEETAICTRSTTSHMDLNTMFAAMMEKFGEVQETSKAITEKLLVEFKSEVHKMSELINNRVDSINRKVGDLETKKTNIDKKVADLETNIDKKVSDLESKLNNLQCQEGAVRIIPETSSRKNVPSFYGTTHFNVFKFQFDTADP
ncbi:hypothetical protein FF38_02088 [Lucilia cuprina]|uniref:SAP domain-containing protein n=1 Tax=Lucilia cuprina TaxID=7375 RepID=A0A0L0CME0_LUCCU|nr:hypothetical protein FF38_02088 [Lucilia cuprina]